MKLKNRFLGWILAGALAFIAASSLDAASPFKVFVNEDNDLMTSADDLAVAKKVRWYDGAEIGFLYERNQFTGDLLVPSLNDNDLETGDILAAMTRAIETWNNAKYAKFSFAENLIAADQVSYYFDPFGSHPRPLRVDGFNMISFLEDEDIGGDVISTIALSYFIRDFDIGEIMGNPGVDTDFINSAFTGEEIAVTTVDFDNDGTPDLFIPIQEYEAGELIEAEILVNPSFTPVLHTFPEDEGDLTDQERFDSLGRLDVEALILGQLGAARGLGRSMLTDAVMFNTLSDSDDDGRLDFGPDLVFDPYAKRKLTFDDELAVGLADGAGFDGATIIGNVISGSAIDNFGEEDDGLSSFEETTDLFLPQVPIYIGVRPEELERIPELANGREEFLNIGFGHPDNVVSEPFIPDGNQGTYRMIAQVMTGLDLSLPAGSGIPQFFEFPEEDEDGDEIDLPSEEELVPIGFEDEDDGDDDTENGTDNSIIKLGNINSTYQIPGLPAFNELGDPIRYAVFLGNDRTIVDPVHQSFQEDEIDEWPVEFYGGPLTQITVGDGSFFLIQQTDDDFFGENFVTVEVNPEGRIAGSIINGPHFLSGFNENPASFFEIRTPQGSFQNKFGHVATPEQAVVIDEDALEAVGIWRRTGNFEIEQEIMVTEEGGLRGVPAGFKVTYTITNISNENTTFSFRQVLDTYLFARENPVYTIGGTVVDNARTFVGSDVPEEIIYQTSKVNPAFSSYITLQGLGFSRPDLVTIGRLQDLSNFIAPGEGSLLTGSDAMTLDSGVALIWNERPLGPGEFLSVSFIVGFFPPGQINDTWVPFDAEDAPDDISPEAFASGTDDPSKVQPITLEPNEVLDGIDIITNTGEIDATTISDVPTEGRPTGLLRFSPEGIFPEYNFTETHGALADINKDGYLDLVTAGFPIGDDPVASALNRVYINLPDPDGDGRVFDDLTFGEDRIPGTDDDRLAAPAESSVGIILADFNNDTAPDIFVTNQYAPNRLYINMKGPLSVPEAERTWGYFVDQSEEYLPGLLNRGWNNTNFALSFDFDTLDIPIGWGFPFRATAGDIDSDGDMDIIISQMVPFTDFLYDNFTGEELQPPTLAFVEGTTDEIPFGDGIPNSIIDHFGGPLYWTERVLINHTITPTYALPPEEGDPIFRDETLGADNRAGTLTDLAYDIIQTPTPTPPPGSPTPTPPPGESRFATATRIQSYDYHDLDRMPPVFPHTFNLSAFDSDSGSFDIQEIYTSRMGASATEPHLGPIYNDVSLDLLSVRGLFANRDLFVSPAPLTIPDGDTFTNAPNTFASISIDFEPGYGQESGYLRNMDILGRGLGNSSDENQPLSRRDGIQDGYFFCFNYGDDFFGELLINSESTTRSYGLGLFPYFLDLNLTTATFIRDANPLFIGIPQDHPITGGVGDLVPSLGPTLAGAIADWQNGDNPTPFLGIDGTGPVTLEAAAGTLPPMGSGAKRGQISGGLFQIGGRGNSYRRNFGPFFQPFTSPWSTLNAGVAPNGQVNGVAHADFDLDGDEDLFLALSSTGGIATLPSDAEFVSIVTQSDASFNQLLLNDSFGNFTDQSSALAANIANVSLFCLAGDIDNDGDEDIIVFNVNDPIEYLENQAIHSSPDVTNQSDTTLFYEATQQVLPPIMNGFALPGFEPALEFATGLTLNTHVAELDGDPLFSEALPDLVLAEGGRMTERGDFNRLFLNRGDAPGGGVLNFQTVGSGYPHRFVSNTEMVLIPDGDDTVPFDLRSFPGFMGLFALHTDTAVADFDRDGDHDLMFVKFSKNDIQSFENDPNRVTEFPELWMNIDVDLPFFNSAVDPDQFGDGIFAKLSNTAIPELIDNVKTHPDDISLKRQTRRVYPGDFDGDGWCDVIFANGLQEQGAPNVLLLNTQQFPDQSFYDQFPDIPTTTPLQRSFIDYTDGSEDFLVGGTFGPNLPVEFVDTAGGPVAQGLLDNTYAIAVGDFDHDGDVDMIFANESESSASGLGFRYLINDGTGVFTDAVLDPDLTGGAMPRIPQFLGKKPRDVVVADFDLLGEPTEDLNFNGFLDAGEDVNRNGVIDWLDLPSETEDLNGNGILDPGEDGSVDVDNDGLIDPPNGVLDQIDYNGDGVYTVRRQGVWEGSLDLYISFDEDVNRILINDPSNLNPGFFTDETSRRFIGAEPTNSRNVTAGKIVQPGSFTGVDIVETVHQGGVTRHVNLWFNQTKVLSDGRVERGHFLDISHEIPFSRARAYLGDVEGDIEPELSFTGWAQDVDLIDLEGDGDLDIMISTLGRPEPLPTFGAYNIFYVNRVIGDNWHARTVDPNQPITSNRVEVYGMNPPSAGRGQTMDIFVFGQNFEPEVDRVVVDQFNNEITVNHPGTQVSLGDGVQVLDTAYVDDNRLRLTIQVAPDAKLGPRTVKAMNTSGKMFVSKSGMFTVYEHFSNPIENNRIPDRAWTLYE